MLAGMETGRPLFPALIRHIALPAVAPAAVTGLYFTPVAVFGCVNRGLMALVGRAPLVSRRVCHTRHRRAREGAA